MWDNEDWAARHIRKHRVKTQEAWEIFERCSSALMAIDQLRFPPYRRYWTVGYTLAGRRLLVIWEQHREICNLVTAFEPDEEKVRLYERKSKKGR